MDYANDDCGSCKKKIKHELRNTCITHKQNPRSE